MITYNKVGTKLILLRIFKIVYLTYTTGPVPVPSSHVLPFNHHTCTEHGTALAGKELNYRSHLAGF